MNEAELSRTHRMVQRVMNTTTLDALGRETGFMVRRRSATAARLALALISAMATQKVETIADLQRAFVRLTGVDIEYKPFHMRLAGQFFGEFMRRVTGRFLDHLVVDALEAIPTSKLSRFTDIIIQDGSSHAVHDNLRDVYPGRFTKLSPAAIELHVTMSLLTDRPIDISLAPDVVGERDFLPAPSELAGMLFLADRGYQDIEYGAEIHAAGGAFLIRCKSNLNPTVAKAHVNGRQIKVPTGGKLKDIRRRLRGKDADLDVWWSRKGKLIAHRMVFIWNPTTAAHMVLLTNLARDEFKVTELHSFYRLRWQVELLFKEWRSYANVRRFNTRKPGIVEGLFWASLAAAYVKRFLVHSASRVCGAFPASTRRAAMTVPDLLNDLIKLQLRGRSIKSALRSVFKHLARYAQRAHPERDRRTGRFQGGLQQVGTTQSTLSAAA
jgi:hypothetical protein